MAALATTVHFPAHAPLEQEWSDNVPVDLIDRSPYQRRSTIDPSHIQNLAQSITDLELTSPLLVRPKGEGRYELISGEHRLAAFRTLGRTHIPAHIKQLSDQDAARILTAENLQRKNLTDWEIFSTSTC